MSTLGLEAMEEITSGIMLNAFTAAGRAGMDVYDNRLDQ
uniref:Uncharacterized protein n=1 Tax=Anguilla anguilla TaxID=7936 RepID=A0A0E9VVB7_ANGAN